MISGNTLFLKNFLEHLIESGIDDYTIDNTKLLVTFFKLYSKNPKMKI
jgi:hypothetical protein